MEKKTYPKVLYLAFATQGVVVGLLSGMSQSPVAAAVVPAVLTVVVGGMLAVIAGTKDTSKGTPAELGALSYGSIAFAICLVVGIYAGVSMREKNWTLARVAEPVGRVYHTSLPDRSRIPDDTPPEDEFDFVDPGGDFQRQIPR